MSGLVQEASSLYSRISSAVRNQPKGCNPDEGTFAALMDSQAEPAPAPKQSQKAEPSVRERKASDPAEPAAETAGCDRAEASDALAPEAKTDGSTDAGTETEAKVSLGQEFIEAIPNAEAAAPADDATTDPVAVEVPAVIVDPNTAATVVVAAPVVSAPVVAATANDAEASETTGDALTSAGGAAAAPTLPATTDSADESNTPAKKADGEQAPKVKAPVEDSEKASAEAAPQTDVADAKDSAAKSAKPAAAQDEGEAKAPQDAASGAPAKPHGHRAVESDAAQPAAKPATEAAPQTATPAPVLPHAATAIAAQPQAAPVSAAQPVPVNALAIEIAGQARAGNSRFEIRLDPPELGRIDVRLDVDRDGNVTSRLVIERSDTYDLLRRDQSTLERALQQAGLKTSDNALEFSLRDQGFAQQQNDESSSRATKAMIAETDVGPSEAASGYARLLNARGGIDIRV